MNWPLPQDFNEAVQNPATAFADPDLKAGRPVVGPTGLPLPRSGNFADVYQIRTPDGRDWAAKCFTRPVTGLDHRYARVGEALAAAGLPFTIGFTFLTEGVRVRGQWMPAVKMEWVDGLLLNQVIRDQAGNPKALDALGQLWARLCKRLRDAGIAHADLQHGNVLLVPGSRPGAYGLKLIDYDGMYVPALANQPSGECGHANYQHPARVEKQAYSPDLDRFPHLVIATALKGLAVVGPALWERYDTGDNLLFTGQDFSDPAASKLMRELWLANHPGLRALVGHLAVACRKPIPQTPWLDQIAPDGAIVPLSPEQARAAEVVLGFAPAVAAVPVAEVVPAAEPAATFAFDVDTPPPAPGRPKGKTRGSDTAERKATGRGAPARASWVPLIAATAVVLLLVLGGGIAAAVFMFTGNPPDETVEAPPENPVPQPQTPKPTPRPGPTPSNPPAPGPHTPVNWHGSVAPLALDPAVTPELKLRWQGGTRGYVVRMEFTPDAEHLVVRERNTGVPVYAAKTGQRTDGLTEGEGPAVGFSVLADGKVASWHLNQPVAIVWNPATGRGIGKVPLPTPPGDGPHREFAVSPDGRYVVVGQALPPTAKADDESVPVTLHDTATRKEVLTLDVRAPVFRFTPDRRLLVADSDRYRWFKLPDGTPDGEFPIPRAATDGRVVITCSPDGTRALHATLDRTVLLVDSANGKPLAEFPSWVLPRNGAISADNRLVALTVFPRPGTTGGSFLGVIDLSTGRYFGRYPLSDRPTIDVQSISFAPDNSAVAISRSSGRIELVDLSGGRVAAGPKPAPPDPTPVRTPLPGAVKQLWTAKVSDTMKHGPIAFDKAGESVLVGSFSTGGVLGFDAATGAPLPPVTGHTFRNVHHFFPVDGGKAATYSFSDRAFCLWDPKTGKATGTIRLPAGVNVTGPVSVLSPNGRYLSTCRPAPTKDGKVDPVPFQVFDATTGKELLEIGWVGGTAHFTGDSARVLVAERSGKLRWFKLPEGRPDGESTVPVVRPTGASRALSVSGDGRVIFYQADTPQGRQYLVLDGPTGRVVRTIANRSDSVDSFVDPGSADGRLFALRPPTRPGEGSAVVVYDGTTGAVAARVTVSDNDRSLRFATLSPDGRRLAVYLPEAGEVKVFELASGAVAATPKPPMPPAPAPPTRPAVPDDEAVARAETQVRGILKAEYAKKSPAEKKALAEKLITLADETNNDPAARYVMYRDARDLAVEGYDAALAVQAVDAMAAGYDVNAGEMKLTAVERVVAGATTPPTLQRVMEQALLCADEATAMDDHEAAVKFARAAARAATKGNLSRDLIQSAEQRVTQARRTGEAFAAVKDALAKLKTDPDDPYFNLAVGRFRCFIQGRWDEGLKLLAKGSDPDLRAAAEQDVATPKTGEAGLELGDVWWEYARGAKDPASKRGAEARARYCYNRAYPDLSGLDKAHVDKRLAFTVGSTEYRPGLVAEFGAKNPTVLKGLKARIDPGVDYRVDEFRDDNIATQVGVRWTGVVVPPRPGKYKLVAKTSDNCEVRVRVEGKVLFDTFRDRRGSTEGSVTLPDRPTSIVIEFSSYNFNSYSLKLNWVGPGTEEEEMIPREVFYHDKKTESVLNKK